MIHAARALPLLLLVAACGDKPDQEITRESPRSEPQATNQAMPRSAAPADARLYFVEPTDGAVVSSPFTVVFGLDGMNVVPAGTNAPASGHHHVIVDAELPPLDRPIPADSRHIHFGDGRTETTLELPPGQHTLQLLLGDYLHIPHDPPVTSGQITITVE